MKLFKILILIGILTGLSSFQMQQDDFQELKNKDSLVAKIKAYTSETYSIKSDFIQEKHLTILEEVLVSEGHFIFQKENSVLWEYTTPIDYAIIVFDGKFTIRDGKKVQEYDIESNRMFKEINHMIITSVSGDFLNNPDFESTYFENGTFYLVRLSPVKPEVNNMLSTIEIYFDKNNISVSQVKFIEPGDDFTLIKFFNKVLNDEIPPQVFQTENTK
ncbi:MAG: outer membrane lipoprotein carrier protein LolA [Bacteroidales bacterium]|jgi:outer membrane lipoprotein-sorting protein|nr:outer membrane lipoprotein carrier protein LolA [Bacteroidales bacterium]